MAIWTGKDVSLMRKLAKEGKSSRQAAKQLRRSREAVAFAAFTRGISFRSLGKKHARLQKARWA